MSMFLIRETEALMCTGIATMILFAGKIAPMVFVAVIFLSVIIWRIKWHKNNGIKLTKLYLEELNDCKSYKDLDDFDDEYCNGIENSLLGITKIQAKEITDRFANKINELNITKHSYCTRY